MGERQLAKMRAHLQDLFGELYLVRDVINVSIEAIQASEIDPEVGRVLFRCGAEKLFGQLHSLSDLIEQLGGHTEFSVPSGHSQVTFNREPSHVVP
jgi:hypothetical protein